MANRAAGGANVDVTEFWASTSESNDPDPDVVVAGPGSRTNHDQA
jgi:hypothetical protein